MPETDQDTKTGAAQFNQLCERTRELIEQSFELRAFVAGEGVSVEGKHEPLISALP